MKKTSESVWPVIAVNLPGGGSERVRFSLPVPEGRLDPGFRLALAGPGGAPIHLLQTRPLAAWADGSPRWIDCQALLERAGDYTIVEGDAPLPVQPVHCREREGEIDLDNGLVSITLSAAGPSPIAAFGAWGRRLAHPELPFEARVESAADGRLFSSAHETARRLRIRERGPVRTVVEVSGAHLAPGGGKTLSYRLRVTVTAGHPVIGLQYGFCHDDPGIESHGIREVSIRTRWPAAARPLHYVHQGRYGLTTVSREVRSPLPVDIRADVSPPRTHVHDTACFEDPHRYPAYLNPPLDDTLPLAGVETEGGWVTAWVEDFKELCPKGLVAEGDQLRLEIWPRWSPALAVPQGRSRDITLYLVFSRDAAPDVRAVTARVRAVGDALKATLPVSWYAANRCWHADSLLPFGGGVARRADHTLSRLAMVPTPVGMWDLGDTIDPGYISTYASAGRLRRLPPEASPRYLAGGHAPLAAWWQPGGFEPVWTNNEYDLILCFCREGLRGHLTPDLWQRLRWFARHAIEVDFIHYSDDPSQCHGSPAHSAEHNHAGAYPSHLWCEGLLAYYCLSGDDDARDVAVAVGDFILRTFGDADRRRKLWHFSRELGWALLYLATVADLTGEKRFLDCAVEIADSLMTEPITHEMARGMTVYAFGGVSIAMGIEALWTVTRRPDLADWLSRMARAVATHADGDESLALTLNPFNASMVLNYFNAALAVAPDERLLRAGLSVLDGLADSPAWIDPPLFAKPAAMLYRGLSRFTKHAQAAGLLAGGRMGDLTAPTRKDPTA